MQSNNSWRTESPFRPGQPEQDDEPVEERGQLLQVIRTAIQTAGLPKERVQSIAQVWNEQHGNLFTDSDVAGIVGWSWRKYGPGTDMPNTTRN